MYGKVFAAMFTGSMMGSGAEVFAVMTYAISNSDEKGHVELNPKHLAALIGSPIDRITSAMEYLQKEDLDSRCKEENGKRLVRQGQFLYWMPAYTHYRKILDKEARKEYQNNWDRENRPNRPNSSSRTPDNPRQPPTNPTQEEEEEEVYTEAPPNGDAVHGDQENTPMVDLTPKPRFKGSHPLQNAWCLAYRDRFGEPYLWQAKDDKAVVKLTSLKDCSVDRIMEIAQAAWLKPDEFNCKHAVSLSGMAARFNEIRAEVGTLKKNKIINSI